MLPLETIRKLFGASLPHNWIGWLGLLVLILGAVTAFQLALQDFVEHQGGVSLTGNLSGFVLPVGWIIWGGLLIYADPTTVPVLIVLVGVLSLLISATLLRRIRSRKAELEIGGTQWEQG